MPLPQFDLCASLFPFLTPGVNSVKRKENLETRFPQKKKLFCPKNK